MEILRCPGGCLPYEHAQKRDRRAVAQLMPLFFRKQAIPSHQSLMPYGSQFFRCEPNYSRGPKYQWVRAAQTLSLYN